MKSGYIEVLSKIITDRWIEVTDVNILCTYKQFLEGWLAIDTLLGIPSMKRRVRISTYYHKIATELDKREKNIIA